MEANLLFYILVSERIYLYIYLLLSLLSVFLFHESLETFI